VANSMWVTLAIILKSVSSNLVLQIIGCEWHCTFFCKNSFSYNKQEASGITYFLKGYLVTSFSLLHRLWVTLNIFFTSNLITYISSYLWLTASKQYCNILLWKSDWSELLVCLQSTESDYHWMFSHYIFSNN